VSRSPRLSDRPRVNVCMPVYNGEAYIEEAIRSILEQTYEDFRLIICDNCSTDNTADIARSFSDARVTYTRNAQNLGLVGNANRCLELADADYISIFHHDDAMFPENLELKVRLLDEHPEIGFVHSDLILVDPPGHVIADHIWCEDSTRDYMEDGCSAFKKFLGHLPSGSSIFIGTVVARKSCYDRIGGFNNQLPHCNDAEMWMRMMLFFTVACIGTPLVRYRVHPSSTSTVFGDYMSLNYLREHCLAANLVFDAYKEHIPDRESLRKASSMAFAQQALRLACKPRYDGDYASRSAFIREALKMNRGIYRSVSFWKAISKLAVGSCGNKFLRAVKERSHQKGGSYH
jgi:glycosyltransferase involved in cell wall biosynthesis